jgi:lipid-A-disaccharide synthase
MLPARPALAWLAGEASGDLLASLVLPEVRRRAPALDHVGVGGERMVAAGLTAWHSSQELSVRGYVEVLRHLPRLLRLRGSLQQRLLGAMPRAFVGVDAPDFNLGLELKLRAAGIPIVHMVAPAVWAWRPERVDLVRRAVDHLLMIFPFEEAIFAPAGVRCTYIGHPLAREIPLAPDAAAARGRLGLPASGPLVALLPGSRPDEITWCAPLFLDAARLMLDSDPGLRFVLPAADAALHARLAALLEARPRLAERTTLVLGRSHDALEASDAVLVASGTATLEAALYKRPMVVSYRMPRLSAWLIRRKGRIPYVALPNILAGRFLVPEFLQEQAQAAPIARALMEQLAPGRREALAGPYAEMHDALLRDTPALAAQAILATAGAGA